MAKNTEAQQKQAAEIRRWMENYIESNGYPTAMDGHIAYILTRRDIVCYQNVGFGKYNLRSLANGALSPVVLTWLQEQGLGDLIAPFERVSVGKYVQNQLPHWERSRNKVRTELEHIEKVIAGYEELKERYGL